MNEDTRLLDPTAETAKKCAECHVSDAKGTSLIGVRSPARESTVPYVFFSKFPHDAHLALHADFIDALEPRRAPRVTGRAALGVHRFIDALAAAARTGTAVPVAGD